MSDARAPEREARGEEELLASHGVTRVRAHNPGPFTLSGTNTWFVGSDPAWLVDPGPDLPEHVAAVIAEVERRGGLGGVALTHDHSDHSGAVAMIRQRFPHAPVAAARAERPDAFFVWLAGRATGRQVEREVVGRGVDAAIGPRTSPRGTSPRRQKERRTAEHQ